MGTVIITVLVLLMPVKSTNVLSIITTLLLMKHAQVLNISNVPVHTILLNAQVLGLVMISTISLPTLWPTGIKTEMVPSIIMMVGLLKILITSTTTVIITVT